MLARCLAVEWPCGRPWPIGHWATGDSPPFSQHAATVYRLFTSRPVRLVERLKEVPCMSETSAQILLAEIGTDMRQFPAVQPVEPNTERHLNAAHDGRFDIVEGNFQACDFGGCNH